MAVALSASPRGPWAGQEPGKILPLSAARVTRPAEYLGLQSSVLPYPRSRVGRLWDHLQDALPEAS